MASNGLVVTTCQIEVYCKIWKKTGILRRQKLCILGQYVQKIIKNIFCHSAWKQLITQLLHSISSASVSILFYSSLRAVSKVPRHSWSYLVNHKSADNVLWESADTNDVKWTPAFCTKTSQHLCSSLSDFVDSRKEQYILEFLLLGFVFIAHYTPSISCKRKVLVQRSPGTWGKPRKYKACLEVGHF